MTQRQRTPTPHPAQANEGKQPGLPVLEEGRSVAGYPPVRLRYQMEVDDYLSGDSSYPAIVLTHEGYAYAQEQARRMGMGSLVEVDFRPDVEGETNRLERLVNSLSPSSADGPRDFFGRWSALLHAGCIAREPPLIFCKGLDALNENETGMLRAALNRGSIRLVADFVRPEQINQSSPAVASPLTLCLHWIGESSAVAEELEPKPLSAERKTALETIAREVIERIAAGRAKGERVLINIHGPSGSGKTSMCTMILTASIGMPFPIGRSIVEGGIEEPVMAGCNPEIVTVLDEASHFSPAALGYAIGRFPWLVLLTHQQISVIKPGDRIDLGDPKLPK